MHLGSLQRDHGRLGPLRPWKLWKLYVSWWMLDLARAAAGDKFVIIAEKVLKLYWWDSCKFCLAMTSVIITYLVAFSATNMHIYHQVGIWHLMQAWARFALQCFSFCDSSHKYFRSLVFQVLCPNACAADLHSSRWYISCTSQCMNLAYFGELEQPLQMQEGMPT